MNVQGWSLKVIGTYKESITLEGIGSESAQTS